MYYGIDIGGTKIELAAFNAKLEKLYTERVPTPQTDYLDWLQAIKTLVERADAHFGEKGTVGLGLPGFVNLTTGLAEVTNIRVADNKPILADLERVLDRECEQKMMQIVLLSLKLVMRKILNILLY